ncbi:hypothetical protein [Acinetobacter guillouiae]|uniref:hypothetical protein n=1 Tax=Acinetobacter guillouiae TaxID=106649 RepID=UPI0028E2ED5B|nr:hypothetical protein [Acinetobacter guillouiae]
MSTNNSPVNPTRSEKLDGGRVRFVVYLPPGEAKQIDLERKKTGVSQSSIIARYYYKGKNNQQHED